MSNNIIPDVDAVLIERPINHGFDRRQLRELMERIGNMQAELRPFYARCSLRGTYVYGFIREEAYHDILCEHTGELELNIIRIVENNEKMEPNDIYHRCNICFHFQRYIETY